MVMLNEIGEGYDNGVTEATVVGDVLHLFGEYVAAVDCARDVADDDGAVDVFFTDFDFSEVDVLDSFVRDGSGPLYAGGIVVVDCRGVDDVRHAQILGAKSDV